jgi:peptidoglycan/LPS O-acetylase OafA/YrhL
MAIASSNQQAGSGRRRIGPAGTTARLVVGLYLLGDVALGHWSGVFEPTAWALGLVGFPAVLFTWHWVRARRTSHAPRANGVVGIAVTLAILLALYFTPQYAPAMAFTSDATLLFLGLSMLVAAVRGYPGCEVLAISNWLLRREDQLGCLLFSPVDYLEKVSRRGK